MKICITSQGQSLDSEVDPRFGRAANFILLDTESMEFSVLANDNAAGAGGVGISSAKAIIDAGTEAVLTGNCGPNAERTLNAAGVKLYFGINGTVVQAAEKFKAGQLNPASGPSVESHSGTEN